MIIFMIIFKRLKSKFYQKIFLVKMIYTNIYEIIIFWRLKRTKIGIQRYWLRLIY